MSTRTPTHATNENNKTQSNRYTPFISLTRIMLSLSIYLERALRGARGGDLRKQTRVMILRKADGVHARVAHCLKCSLKHREKEIKTKAK